MGTAAFSTSAAALACSPSASLICSSMWSVWTLTRACLRRAVAQPRKNESRTSGESRAWPRTCRGCARAVQAGDLGQSFWWTDEQRVDETVYDMLEPGGALALIVHTVRGGPGHQALGCLRSLTMRSRRWCRSISDLPGAPAKAPPQNELTASRMCWPGLAWCSQQFFVPGILRPDAR